MNTNNTKVSFVFFGPANVGKSTIIGYIKTHDLSEAKFLNEINKKRRELGNNYQNDRLFSYFVDDHKDEYTKNIDKIHGETKGTSKYAHIKEVGDFYLIDTPGNEDYESERFKGISLANIGIFAIEIKHLLKLETNNFNTEIDNCLKAVKQFFSSWYVWKKLHGTNNAIILLTKYDSFPSEEYFNKAKNVLNSIIGENLNITVIPTSIEINTEKRRDINVYTKQYCEWYKGKTLMQAIEEKYVLVSKIISPLDLLMFYNRRYENVRGTGSIIKWKINSGSLKIKNRLTIAPVIINNKYLKVNASIKSMHNENNENLDSANAGEIVNIALSNIVYDNSTIQRDKVEILNTSIIVNSDRKIIFGNLLKVKVNFSQCAKDELLALKRFNINYQVRILWFGKVLFPSIRSIEIKNKEEFLFDLDLTNKHMTDLPHMSQVALPYDSLPKKILMQNKPINKDDQLYNYDCLVLDIFN